MNQRRKFTEEFKQEVANQLIEHESKSLKIKGSKTHLQLGGGSENALSKGYQKLPMASRNACR